MFGSITLNKVVGGINPKAVDVALKLGAKVVWLPTASAKNHLMKLGQDPSQGVDIVVDGKVVPELETVFSLIREHNAVLGTAHVSPQEAFVVVEAARKAGVENIVVTHPEWWIVGMSLEDQVRLVQDYDVVLERCYAQNMGGGVYKSNLADNVAVIQKELIACWSTSTMFVILAVSLFYNFAAVNGTLEKMSSYLLYSCRAFPGLLSFALFKETYHLRF